MKSEHRHELQANDLSKITGRLSELFERYGNQITIVVCAASLIFAGSIYWSRRTASQTASAWNEYTSASKAEDFIDVAEQYGKTPAAPWARLQAGESRLVTGIQLMFTDREPAVSELKKAQEDFQILVDDRRTPPEVRERALFGLARCQESLSTGEEGPAIKTYEMLVAEFPNSVLKPSAEQRIKALKSGSAQEFYAWFSKLTPKPPAPPGKPLDGQGTTSDDEKAGESDPALQLPSLAPLTKPDMKSETKTVEPDTTVEETPAPELKPQSDTKPADKAADKKPAEKSAAKPAAKPVDKPATKAPEKSADKAAETAKPDSEKPAPTKSEKPAAKAPEKSADESADKPADKPAEKATDKPAEDKP